MCGSVEDMLESAGVLVFSSLMFYETLHAHFPVYKNGRVLTVVPGESTDNRGIVAYWQDKFYQMMMAFMRTRDLSVECVEVMDARQWYFVGEDGNGCSAKEFWQQAAPTIETEVATGNDMARPEPPKAAAAPQRVSPAWGSHDAAPENPQRAESCGAEGRSEKSKQDAKDDEYWPCTCLVQEGTVWTRKTVTNRERAALVEEGLRECWRRRRTVL